MDEGVITYIKPKVLFLNVEIPDLLRGRRLHHRSTTTSLPILIILFLYSATGHCHSQDSKKSVLAPNMHYLDCIIWRLQIMETLKAPETKDLCT